MCYSIAKYLLFAFNFVFWLAGAAIFGVGIYLVVEPDLSGTIEVAGLDVYYTGSYLMIAAGCIMLVVGFFGCCGAIKESTCLLGFYFGFLLVILGLEVGIGIWALVEYGDLQPAIDAGLNTTFKSYKDLWPPSDNTVYGSQISTQQNLQCCGGMNGCQDWWFASESIGCGCTPDDTNAGNCMAASKVAGCAGDSNNGTASAFIYTEPCSNAIYTFVQDNYQLLGIICISIGCAEVLGLIVSMCLCCSIKDKKKGISA